MKIGWLPFQSYRTTSMPILFMRLAVSGETSPGSTRMEIIEAVQVQSSLDVSADRKRQQDPRKNARSDRRFCFQRIPRRCRHQPRLMARKGQQTRRLGVC